jgi:hypothetical protein
MVNNPDIHVGASGQKQSYNLVIRFFAHLFSFVFHPLFIVSYIIALLVFVHPLLFAGFEGRFKLFRLIAVFFSTAFLPVFSIFLLWRLRFIPSMFLRSSKDRIIPYIIVMVFYFWIWYVFNNQPENPAITVHLLLGAFLAICGGWFCNIYFKISLHAIAMGGLLVFALLFSFTDTYASGLYLSAAVLIAGIVCTSRLIVSDHSPFQVYSGLLMGALTQYIAWQF